MMKTFSLMRFAARLAALASILSWLSLANAEIPADFLNGTDPAFDDLEMVKDFQRDFKGIWQQALQREEVDYQRMAAETVARAHIHGIPHLEELIPDLETILSAPKSHPAARFAAARALIVLDSRDSAEKLMDAGLNHGSDLRQLVEPTLAAWDYAPIREIWLKRFDEPQTYPRDLILALRGLGQVRDENALPIAKAIAADLLQPEHIRMEAAAAAGAIADSGLESDASDLARETRRNPFINQMCAISYLSRHTSEPAIQLLLELAEIKTSAVKAAALQRLNGINPELVVSLAEEAMRNKDPSVRKEGVYSYIHVPAPERIRPLARMLADVHPTIRQTVAEGLVQLASQPNLNEVVRSEAMIVLSGDRWQGQEQAAMIIGTLDHKPAAKRLVQLLDSSRPEVMIHTAWALRKLAVPETIPGIVDKIQRQTIERKQRTIPGVDEQVAHLFEACGLMHVMDAEPLMQKYIAKDRSMDSSRSAAIWALGHLYLETPENPVAKDLTSRVLDDDPQNPENPYIKEVSVVALARMQAKQHAGELRETIAGFNNPTALGLATHWAVKELTGEELPFPTPLRYPDGSWFLEPIDTVETR